ncbi:2-C-methyl-D-erythritol 2,4-cyclodiphosphate synthase [candidate division KSB1 bacterium]|nr:MAG: 2-C-methyl-D-erythritol 2,4-cyclodiphosphate synthase [candidate division KSB1 bacterium]
MRVGIGYDVHRLVEDRKLILGGIEIPFDKGLFGHSDADVLSHAIGDALLGAAGLGDLGTHFPDTEQKWKNICSLKILSQIQSLLTEQNLRIEYVDSVIVMDRPKIKFFVPQMQENIAHALSVPVTKVSIKATTNEGLGFIGKGEGIAAYAVALLL